LESSPSNVAAAVGDALRIVRQRKNVAADDGLLGITRQIERRELSGAIGRDAKPLRDEAVATFDAAGPGIGVELYAQPIDACNDDALGARRGRNFEDPTRHPTPPDLNPCAP
jgi:hypothetical protein